MGPLVAFVMWRVHYEVCCRSSIIDYLNWLMLDKLGFSFSFSLVDFQVKKTIPKRRKQWLSSTQIAQMHNFPSKFLPVSWFMYIMLFFCIIIYMYIVLTFDYAESHSPLYSNSWTAGFFVTIWITAFMFKSNDILRKQTALKV